MNDDYRAECHDCGRTIISNDGTDGYCPECVPSGHRDHRRQRADQRAQERRNRIVQGRVGVPGGNDDD